MNMERTKLQMRELLKMSADLIDNCPTAKFNGSP